MVTQPYHRQNLAAAIQQVARQQLEKAGANQLSLRQIARVLAVTPAAVYRHFPDKASLLANLKTTIQAEVTATLRMGVLDSADAPTMLRQMVTNLLTYQHDHPYGIQFVLTGDLSVPQSLTTVVTLCAAQQQLTLEPQSASLAVWTYLVGVLVLLPTIPVDEKQVTSQLISLLGG
ncbi:TetR/AcrR family transcriptional regulator [Levilactobacillus brevis]|uniref:TetR/AcrR family transcriptional regulator n=1 Tax=Levilactobacillus brevis TaxID=1580 RepID=UPI001BDE4886|nr:TetR/AcrR family transcriptional regulator [Levilactobacillus brevis]